MPLTVDSVVHGPGAKPPARAMMLALSEELFNHLRDAVISGRSHSTTKGNHPPAPVELDFTRQQSATEKSPGSLYIGGQALRLTSIPERIFDLYAQPHVPNDTPNTNPLRLHAIVSQSLKVPLSLSDNLAERLHNRTVSEEKERSKRGVVRIDNPTAQANPKKRKLSPSAEPKPIPAAVPKRAPPRPSQPAVQTLSGPPLSAESLARHAVRSNASASDSSSSSSQPLAQQAHPRLNGGHTATQLPISRSISQSSDKITPPVSSTHQAKPISSLSSARPSTSTPITESARTPSEGWKTSNFRGGIKTKGPPKSATTKATGGTASGSTKARVKSNPIITDDLDEPSPPASSSRAAAVPRDTARTKSNGGAAFAPVVKAGTKRARESSTSVTYDAFTADADLLAAVDVASSKRGAARAVEAELIAAATATTNGKKPAPPAATNPPVTVKKARAPTIDDELLDAAAVESAPSKTTGSSATAVKGKSRVAKISHDDEDWDIREERRQQKKASARASTGSVSAAPATQLTATGTNGRVKKAVVLEAPARGSPPVRANGNIPTTATVGKKRPLAAQPSASTSSSNGGVNGNAKVGSSQAHTNGPAKSAAANGSASKRSGHVRLSRRASPIYTDSDEEPPSKPIPNVPKTKHEHPKPLPAVTTGAVPPSPVSTTTSASKPTNTTSSRVSGARVAEAVPVKKRSRLEVEDKRTDALMALPLPRSRSALRDHYDTCYASYIELWARILKEKQRQRKLLRSANGTGSDNDEHSSTDSVGENVEALTDRYSKLHERLQTIRGTLGLQQVA